MTTLAEQVAGLEVGDWVEAVYESVRGRAVITGPLLEGFGGSLITDYRVVRYNTGKLDGNLISITRVPRPIPSEPEVGSFALTDIEGHVAQRKVYEDRDVWIRSASGGKPHRYSWPEIYPHIVKLYTPSGELVTGFEYAGERK